MADGDKKQLNRRDMLKYSGLVTTGSLFAGCTGNKQSGSPTATPGSGGGTDTGTQSGGGSSKNTTFRYVTGQTPSSIDPAKVSDNLETILAHNVYDPLLYYTNGTPPKLQNWLAKDYTVGDDKRTYTFTLRDDATFHNGDQVTAEDVKYSFQRVHDMQQGFSWMWSGILKPSGITVIDEKTVEMKTEKVFAPFTYTLPFLFIVNKSQVEANAKTSGNFGSHGDYGTAYLEKNDAGSGPYKLTSRQRKQRIDLDMNENWWSSFAKGNIYEKVVTEMVQENATMVGMMKEGKATMTDQWLPLQSYKDLSQTKGVNVHAKATFNPFYIFMHTQREPLNDVHVRKAISYAFDYKAALQDVMSGESKHLVGPLPSAMWSHTDNLPKYNTNIKKAKEHMNQSDYSSGDISLTYTYVSGLTVEKNMGLLLQSQLNKIGIDLKIEKAPWTKIVSMATQKSSTPDMLAVYLSFNYADPDTFLYPAWHTQSNGSWQSASWYSNPEVDSLLDEARTTIGKDKRVPLYQEAQKLIADDAPAIFVMNQATRNAISEDLRGFKDNGVTGYRQTFHWFHQA